METVCDRETKVGWKPCTLDVYDILIRTVCFYTNAGIRAGRHVCALGFQYFQLISEEICIGFVSKFAGFIGGQFLNMNDDF